MNNPVDNPENAVTDVAEPDPIEVTGVEDKQVLQRHEQGSPEVRWQPLTDNTLDGKKTVRPGSTIKPRKLTRKQQEFIKQLVTNPKQSATKAVLAVYGKPDKPLGYDTAGQIASENLRKPQIMAELAKHSATAEMTLIEVLNQSKNKMYDDSKEAVGWAVNARQTADSLLDRLHGKATQRTETVSTAVNLNLNLSDIAD